MHTHNCLIADIWPRYFYSHLLFVLFYDLSLQPFKQYYVFGNSYGW